MPLWNLYWRKGQSQSKQDYELSAKKKNEAGKWNGVGGCIWGGAFVQGLLWSDTGLEQVKGGKRTTI